MDGGHSERALWRGWQGCLLAMLLPVLVTGCHKKVRVSQNSVPPAPPASRPRTTSPTTAHRTPPPAVLQPNTNTDDNTPSDGRVHAVEIGMASWYAPSGRRSANGDIYDGQALTAAHRTLPLGTVLRVTNLTTNLAVTVTVTDRGPFVHGRVLDLSTAAARETGVYRMGVAQVRMEVVRQPSTTLLGGRWCVQTGAFADERGALQLKGDLQRRYGSVARVIEFQGSTGYWVRLNPLDGDRRRASSIAESLRPGEPAAQAWLVRVD